MTTIESEEENQAEATPGVESDQESEQAPEEASDQESDQEPEEDEEAEATPPTSPLSEAVNELVEDNARLKDRLLRTAAEFENYKKRARRDMTERVKMAEERVVLDFLNVADNLERALSSADEAEGESRGPLRDGVDMVYKQLLGTLERYNIKPFESVGDAFNPERHEAIQQMISDEPVGAVIFEMRKGYLRGDKLVRAAMVVVSKGPATEEKPEKEAAPPEEEAPAPPDEAEEEGGQQQKDAARPAPIGAPPADDDEEDPGARRPGQEN